MSGTIGAGTNETSMDKIIEKIHNSTGLLNNIYESNVIEKPSYKMYMFSSEEQFKDEIYQSYTLFTYMMM